MRIFRSNRGKDVGTSEPPKQRTLSAQQVAEFETWKSSKPAKPQAKRPKQQRSDDTFGVVLTLVLAFFGFLTGIGMMFAGGVRRDADLMTVGSIGIIGFPLAIFALGILGMFALFWIQDAVYVRELKRLGWAEYDDEYRMWQLMGDQLFGEYVEHDFTVWIGMNDAVYDGKARFNHDLAARSAGKRTPTGDTELDDLEDRLDTATPGFRHGIELPSMGSFRRQAKKARRHRQQRLEAGKAFIAEYRFPARRRTGPNSAGWISNMPITEQETAAVRRLLEPYFTAEGLNVAKFKLGWRGMSDGPGGAFESLEVVVRVV